MISSKALSVALTIVTGIACLMDATAADPMRDLIETYEADADLLSRHWSISGDSEAELARETALRLVWQGRLAEVNFDALPPDQRVDSILLRNEFASSLTGLERRKAERQELAAWLPFRGVIDALADARVTGEPLNPEKAAGLLAPLADQITKLQEQLKSAKEPKKEPEKAPAVKPPAPPQLPTPEQALRAAEATDALASSLKRWFENYNGFEPEFGWWVKQPYEEISKALEAYAKFAREELAGIKGKDEDPLLGRAIGAEALQKQLAYEFIPYTPEELIALAEREFSWCEQEMKKAAQEMKLGDDWKAALARAKSQYGKPGEQETVVRDETKQAIAFVKSHQLVTVPADCVEWWGTRMLSPEEQKQTPYVAYGGHDVLIAYASDGMKYEDKLMSMRGNSRPFMHNVVPHEMIPGHHLQSYMAARNKPYRRMFSTPFFVEGWALYWEMRLWDMGYHETPEQKIGALFWRMHRCARIIVTLKFHLGQMKPEEMVTFLTDRVGHEKFGATSEVRRFIKGNYAPLYQCGYMLGGLQLRALHQEIVGGGQMTELQFHDAILKLGPIPVELIRASLRDLPLTRDYTAQWKFDATHP
jgi:uncharacterized protein (DUF885 family)